MSANFARAFCIGGLIALCAETAYAESTAAPTAADADRFVAQINADLRRMLPYLNSAQWLQATYITDDSQMISARANEEFLGYQARKVQEAKRFNGLSGLSKDTARALMLLKNVTAPAPGDAAKQAELARILSAMEANYGAGKWCRSANDCLNLTQIEKIVNDPKQTPATRAAAWKGWHDTARAIRARYARFVELANEGSREMGFANTGEVWRSGYDMTPAQFERETERLWTQLKPLYLQVHAYVRARLNAQYGDALVPKKGPIPAHLLGNMWAQSWSNIYPLVQPYRDATSADLDGALRARREALYRELVAANPNARSPEELAELGHRADAAMSVKMTEMAQDFYTSIGMPKLPASFWKSSMLLRPRDRDVVCHASAWDMDMKGDVRIKMCIEPTEEDLTTIHHEIGHLYYDLMYNPLPPMFQNAAHDGFHEAIGDTIALSLTPAHLAKIGLSPAQKSDPKAVIDAQMRLALDKIVFLPWGKLVDQWRWKVFSGEVEPQSYNAAWWKLRRDYQGLAPPVPRSEQDFDPGAKYHVPANTPYTRYFLSFVLQFQFQKALCQAAGYKGPLHECDIYGNKAAGKRFMAMLAQGASEPWQDTLQKLTGTRSMDASALIEYFAPLMAWLKEQNAGQPVGW